MYISHFSLFRLNQSSLVFIRRPNWFLLANYWRQSWMNNIFDYMPAKDIYYIWCTLYRKYLLFKWNFDSLGLTAGFTPLLGLDWTWFWHKINIYGCVLCWPLHWRHSRPKKSLYSYGCLFQILLRGSQLVYFLIFLYFQFSGVGNVIVGDSAV
jgi:hypothetical protein